MLCLQKKAESFKGLMALAILSIGAQEVATMSAGPLDMNRHHVMIDPLRAP